MGYGVSQGGTVDSSSAFDYADGGFSMFASSMLPELILRECPDRRRQERFIHRESVQVDGRPVIGRDISASGIGILMRTPPSMGALVSVTVSDQAHGGQITAPARVARVQPIAGRVIVGLQFVNQ